MSEFDQNERLASAINGDRSALAQLLVEHTPQLTRRIGQRLALNPFADFGVEDVLQEVYIDVLRGISTFRPEESTTFAAWIQRVADNRLVEMLRFRSRQKRGGKFRQHKNPGLAGSIRDIVAMLSDHREGTGSDLAQHADLVQTLEAELMRLPVPLQTAVREYYIEQQSLDETAHAMQTTPAAVRGFLYRAKLKLRSALGQSSRWFSRK